MSVHHLRSDCSSELDQVAGSDEMPGEEGLERVDSLVDAVVRGEGRFNVTENDHGTVGSCSLQFSGPGESNGIMECETKSLMDVLAALVFKEILLQIITKGEKYTALAVDSSAHC